VDGVVQGLSNDYSSTWTQYGSDISTTFASGDQFGAIARSTGSVEIYKNGTLLATVDASAWTHSTDGGYIGLWVTDASGTVLDDFGGGTLPLSAEPGQGVS